jgi:hypothetical protein
LGGRGSLKGVAEAAASAVAVRSTVWGSFRCAPPFVSQGPLSMTDATEEPILRN